ncbi:membrane-anchored protein YejM (alkaline phosphatase superfamily) [Sphingomonas kaistensis]|uniref:Membrane-anchored protein YejM (Alkaline phosphatase superfamily) n=1 Tax=Sphingomonas kaistensis TaxID=298708 RepID=A0A7X5Y419_9SPHN|nr:hypothetical protein [Sphingomonas kaistensis]NJC04696.1 membrane-anchored protein YejM (alkaline phosphatase superfamily) [Sphingomonas kaistensis]
MEQEQAVFDWKDLLLAGGLFLIIFLPLDLVIEWLAARWDITMLHARYRQMDVGTALAVALSLVIASRLFDALGSKRVKRPTKLDSGPPLP